jgi:drug/metabolite transporter (DMT)-like permease
MNKSINYVFFPLMAILLVTAQACWGSFIKQSAKQPLRGSLPQILTRFISSPKIWIGATLYIIATVVYFVLLSKYKFFAVQTVMAGIAIIFSTLLSYILFHEKISAINIVGMLLVIGGITLIFNT